MIMVKQEKKSRAFIRAKETEVVLFTVVIDDKLELGSQKLSATAYIKAGGEIVLSYMEHHSNVIPWQQLAKRTGAVLKYTELTEEGFLDMEDAAKKDYGENQNRLHCSCIQCLRCHQSCSRIN